MTDLPESHSTPPPAERSSRITATAWIALGVVVAVIFVSILAVTHKPGVQAIAPGQAKITSLHAT